MSGPSTAARLLPDLLADQARLVSDSVTGRLWRIPRRGGAPVAVKQPHTPGAAAAEAAGLRALAAAGVPAVPVLAAGEGVLVLPWLAPVAPDAAAARAFGAALAGARTPAGLEAGFGATPGDAGTCWIGAAALPATPRPTWAEHYVHDRLRPTAARAATLGHLAAGDAAAVERLCRVLLARPQVARPPQHPVLLHGDLWSGNLLWTDTGVQVVDPAAHTGHPETDLAMLHLFGAPHLDAILAGYQQHRVLPAGWRKRLPLHQLLPLLVHAWLFGGGYGAAAGDAARAALRVAG